MILVLVLVLLGKILCLYEQKPWGLGLRRLKEDLLLRVAKGRGGGKRKLLMLIVVLDRLDLHCFWLLGRPFITVVHIIGIFRDWREIACPTSTRLGSAHRPVVKKRRHHSTSFLSYFDISSFQFRSRYLLLSPSNLLSYYLLNFFISRVLLDKECPLNIWDACIEGVFF